MLGVNEGSIVWKIRWVINVERLVIKTVPVESDRYGRSICRMMGSMERRGLLRP